MPYELVDPLSVNALNDVVVAVQNEALTLILTLTLILILTLTLTLTALLKRLPVPSK